MTSWSTLPLDKSETPGGEALSRILGVDPHQTIGEVMTAGTLGRLEIGAPRRIAGILGRLVSGNPGSIANGSLQRSPRDQS